VLFFTLWLVTSTQWTEVDKRRRSVQNPFEDYVPPPEPEQ
jgi:hypothetical protein